MKNTKTLAEYLESMNDEARAFNAAAKNGEFQMLMGTDLTLWAECGITTADQLDEYFTGCLEEEERKQSLNCW